MRPEKAPALLAGEIKLLQYFHFHGHSRKTLGRNGVFQGIDVFFMNPLPAADIDPDMILSLVDSHLSDYYPLPGEPAVLLSVPDSGTLPEILSP